MSSSRSFHGSHLQLPHAEEERRRGQECESGQGPQKGPSRSVLGREKRREDSDTLTTTGELEGTNWP